jgi:hypothetical protein
MTNYLIPTNEEIIEAVARSIAHDRLMRDAVSSMGPNVNLDTVMETFERVFDNMFETVWAGTTPHDEMQKEAFRLDAVAAIRTINLNLLVS